MITRLRCHTSRTWRWYLAWSWLGLLLLGAALAGLLPERFTTPDLAYTDYPPLAPGHPLGTDPLGQDVLAALLYGARTALLVSLPTAFLTTALGIVLGLLAGYWGNSRLRIPLAYLLAAGGAASSYVLFTTSIHGVVAVCWPLLLASAALATAFVLKKAGMLRRTIGVPLDATILLSTSLLSAAPRLLLVLTLAAATYSTIPSLVLLLTLTCWTQTARLVRAEVQRVRRLPYFEAAQAAGLPPLHLVLYYLLPSSWLPVRTTFPLSIGLLITLETTLSFLGVGLPPEVPSWGRLLAVSRLAPASWWLLLFPVICLLFTMLALRHLLPATRMQSMAPVFMSQNP